VIVVMEEGAPATQIAHVEEYLAEHGVRIHRVDGTTRTVLGLIGDVTTLDRSLIESFEGVYEVVKVSEPFKLANRKFKPEGTVVQVGDVRIGGDEVIVMAGPCSAESEEQVFAAAAAVKRAGAKIFRGGAFKPRSSPYSFQGLGEAGLKLLRTAANEHNMQLISEVMDLSQIDLLEKYVDILQVGARNMQNFTFLKELGKTRKPILLKRGMSATIQELLLSAEYILAGGNRDVILCERGIRTFENFTRNTLDISAIPVLKSLSHLPVVADPSHGTGIRDKVPPMARASVAAGADGLLIEVHHDPDRALCDGAQSLLPEQLKALTKDLKTIAAVLGRTFASSPLD